MRKSFTLSAATCAGKTKTAFVAGSMYFENTKHDVNFLLCESTMHSENKWMHMLWRRIAELEQIKEPLLFSDSIKFTGCSCECEPEPL